MDSSATLLMREMIWSQLVLPASWHFIPRTNAVYWSPSNCVHSKSPSASTFHEVQNLRDFELIKSPSKDKRWAIRESSAKVSRFYLLSPVREANDEQWGPEWNELLTLEPAPTVVMDNDAVDPAQ